MTDWLVAPATCIGAVVLVLLARSHTALLTVAAMLAAIALWLTAATIAGRHLARMARHYPPTDNDSEPS